MFAESSFSSVSVFLISRARGLTLHFSVCSFTLRIVPEVFAHLPHQQKRNPDTLFTRAQRFRLESQMLAEITAVLSCPMDQVFIGNIRSVRLLQYHVTVAAMYFFQTDHILMVKQLVNQNL